MLRYYMWLSEGEGMYFILFYENILEVVHLGACSNYLKEVLLKLRNFLAQ